jgi:DNA polymerase III subunit beta
VIKATVSGQRCTPAFQPRYLADALRAFAGRNVRLALRLGVRQSSVITSVDPDSTGAELSYVLMPKRP